MHADEIEQIQGPLTTSLEGRLHGVTFVGPGLHKIPALTLNLMSTFGKHGAFAMLLIVDGAELRFRGY